MSEPGQEHLSSGGQGGCPGLGPRHDWGQTGAEISGEGPQLYRPTILTASTLQNRSRLQVSC